MRVLAIGDVVGKTGTDFVRSVLPAFRRVKGVDLCVINGENAAPNNGITPANCEELFLSGADVITTGNHVYRRRELYDYLEEHDDILRPANFPDSTPGKGSCIIDKGRVRVGVINLLGTTYMDPLGNPFAAAEEALKELEDCRIVLVDFHAEATSEKRAMGFFLDGKVSALFGTHTHVQTADEQILPGGTGYITDLGMVGAEQSVLGVKPEIMVERFRTHLPARFEPAEGSPFLCGCLFDIDEKTGACTAVERICLR
ncbi:MAG: TIGR00282 family metallophosphoesterase [Clostridia bacterium]|nr:TIGR00282 family metallophosphoesterase [Clostridia bacterium]